MKIAYLTPGTVTSSMSYRPLSFAKGLVSNGHEAYFLTPRYDKYSQFKDSKISQIDGITVLRPYQSKKLPYLLSLIPYVISSIYLLYKTKPDVIHMYKTTPVTLPALLLKLTHKTPVILDVDDLDSEVMRIEGYNRLLTSLVKLSELIAPKYADATVAASKFLEHKYRILKKKNNVVYVPNGADFLKEQDISLKTMSKNRIIFVGNINRINILEPLFYATEKIAKMNKPISIVIIGDGTYFKYFKQLTKKLEIQKNVTFLGRIDRKNLSSYIQAGDIGYSYMPNEDTIKACSSMKVFQYLQFGCIPLVSNVGDFPYYVFHGKAGYIANSNDIDSLTTTIIKAFTNKKGNLTKINYARQHAKETYKWEVLAKKVERLYKKVYEKK